MTDTAAERITARLDRIPDSDALLVEKTDLRELLAEHKALRRQVREARVIALRDISEPGTGICPTAYQIYLATGGQPLARDVAADTEADLRAARDMLRRHDGAPEGGDPWPST